MNILYILYLMAQRRISYQMHLLGIGLIILLAACDSESTLVPVTPEPEVPEETGYLSVSINVGDALTTRAYTGTSPGEIREYFVQSVRLVLYNGTANTSTVIRSIDYDIKSNDLGGNWWTGGGLSPATSQARKDQFITLAEAVPNMDYEALVLINPTANMKSATEKGKTFGEFDAEQKIETAGKTADIGGLAKDKNFVMTNAKGLVHVDKSTYLHPSMTAAHNKPVPVLVQRVVAKVTLISAGGTNIVCNNPNATANNLTWGLDITNRKTFWMRKPAEGEGLNEPVENWYAKDPNYALFGTKSEDERKMEFFYYLSGSKSPVLPNTLNQLEYCLENTMDVNDQPYDKIITRVLIRCTYKPENVTALGNGFYYYVNGLTTTVYTEEEMKILLSIAEEQAVTHTESDLSQAILDLKAQGYDLSTGSVPKRGGVEVTESFKNQKIKYYYKGINYYAIKIRHFGENDTPLFVHGHYGVLRNTFYTVKLDKINGPGAMDLEDTGISTRSASSATSELYQNIDATITINNRL